MVAIGNTTPGTEGARAIFGAIIAAGVITIFIAPQISRMLRFFPPVMTGTIILVIGVSLMRIGIHWIFCNPVSPSAPMIIDRVHADWLKAVSDLAATGAPIPDVPAGLALAAKHASPAYAPLGNVAVSAMVLLAILAIARFGRGFVASISVLLGIVTGGVVAIFLGKLPFDKVGEAAWFGLITPFHFGTPTIDPVMILTMTLVMVVVMIKSTGMFLALGDITGRKISRPMLMAGLRSGGLGTLIGSIFNTFPYTSFSQNVGLVGVTGIKSRFVCVAGGVILIVLGLMPKMGALVEALPLSVLGGAGLVMFGRVAATGIRILSKVDFASNCNNCSWSPCRLGSG